MISKTELWMIDDLKEIWKQSFGDVDEYINLFFSNRLRFDYTYVYMNNEKPVSMLMMMPASIYINGGYHTVNYVYGVSTLPEHRGNGFSSKLLMYANQYMPNDAEASFLHPAEDSLFNYYKKQKYKTAFYIKEATLNLNEMNINQIDFDYDIASPEEYKALRDSCFENEGYINWDIDAIGYALLENAFFEGKALVVNSRIQRDIVLYRVVGKTLIVKETSVSDKKLLLSLLNKLMIENKTDNVFLRLHPSSTINLGTPKCFAMIYDSDFELAKGYFNLALD